MVTLPSYPKIYALGHAALRELTSGMVSVEEKIDGSQFSFGVFNGELMFRSRNNAINPDAPDKMFAAGVGYVKSIAAKLAPEYIYRGEYLQKPKHNTLAYDRTPQNHIILFDINTLGEFYLNRAEKEQLAADIGLEVVPLLYTGELTSFETFKEMLQRVSVLGGQKIEGVVVKNYGRFGTDGKALMGKYVSEAFKELHNSDWKDRNPGGKDIIASIVENVKTPARWDKAIQHLKERGELQGAPQDIGPLLKELVADTWEECGGEIREVLFNWAKKGIGRELVKGFPEYYKNLLAESQFREEEAS